LPGRIRSAQTSTQLRITWLEQRVQELEQLLDEINRAYEIDGDQIVQVGRYAYRWRGPSPLNVGDRVLLPENWLSRAKYGPGPFEDIVTGLGTNYQGELSFILRQLPPEKPATTPPR